MNSETSLDLLRRANSELERFFAGFSGARVEGTNQEVAALMQVERALRSIGALLNSGLQQTDNREMQQELASYRANLLRLRRELAVMQDSAASSRARLVTRQTHLHAAREWCDASRATQ